MLIEETKLVKVVTFRTLHLHHCELDYYRVLSDMVLIVDELDLQLAEAVNCFEPRRPLRAA